MRCVLAAVLFTTLASCRCGPPQLGADAGELIDGGEPTDAGLDAGPICGPELCDGIDNDCNGTIDLAADGGPLSQLCPLQLGTCQGARVQCQAGTFLPCAGEYGAKYEELESLCDGVDNDCSGVVDVSQWRPIGMGSDIPTAVSVPGGGWFIGTGGSGQMFDDQLRPTSDLFPVGRAGLSDRLPSRAISFGGYLNQLFKEPPAPAVSYVRRLNLDGTYAPGPDGGPLEIDLGTGHASLFPGSLTASNDRSSMLVAFTQGSGLGTTQELLTLSTDGGTRAALTLVSDGGQWWFKPAAVAAEDFVVGLAFSSGLQLQVYSPDLLPLGVPVDLATPADSVSCSVSTDTSTPALGTDSVVAACPDQRRLYAAQNVFSGGMLVPFWEADAGTITSVHVLPSYARATVFWKNASTVWMGQVNSAPAAIAGVEGAFGVAPSIRGGYLLTAHFDGGQGPRPYAAYVCPP